MIAGGMPNMGGGGMPNMGGGGMPNMGGGGMPNMGGGGMPNMGGGMPTQKMQPIPTNNNPVQVLPTENSFPEDIDTKISKELNELVIRKRNQHQKRPL